MPYLLSIPSSYKQALATPRWKHAMDEAMSALHKNQTWKLTALPPEKQMVGCVNYFLMVLLRAFRRNWLPKGSHIHMG